MRFWRDRIKLVKIDLNENYRRKYFITLQHFTHLIFIEIVKVCHPLLLPLVILFLLHLHRVILSRLSFTLLRRHAIFSLVFDESCRQVVRVRLSPPTFLRHHYPRKGCLVTGRAPLRWNLPAVLKSSSRHDSDVSVARLATLCSYWVEAQMAASSCGASQRVAVLACEGKAG